MHDGVFWIYRAYPIKLLQELSLDFHDVRMQTQSALSINKDLDRWPYNDGSPKNTRGNCFRISLPSLREVTDFEIEANPCHSP